MEEKTLYQLADPWNVGAFPISWGKLPDEVIKNLNYENFSSALSYSAKESSLNYVTVVYFRKVKKFRKNITPVEYGEIIFGV